ncbi:MAG: hypothetical protein AAGJ08_25145 [Cyanobacteria bacterium P01_H01_bin.35]
MTDDKKNEQLEYENLPVEIQRDIYLLLASLATVVNRLSVVTNTSREDILIPLMKKAEHKFNAMNQSEREISMMMLSKLFNGTPVNPPDEANAETTNDS